MTPLAYHTTSVAWLSEGLRQFLELPLRVRGLPGRLYTQQQALGWRACDTLDGFMYKYVDVVCPKIGARDAETFDLSASPLCT